MFPVDYKGNINYSQAYYAMSHLLVYYKMLTKIIQNYEVKLLYKMMCQLWYSEKQ